MYLIQLASGAETLYPTLAHFTDAIRRGEVTEQAKIYHRTREIWVAVPAHPTYRQVVAAERAGRARHGTRSQWTFLPAAAPTTDAPDAAREAATRVAAEEPPAAGAPAVARRRNWRRVLGGLFSSDVP